MQQATPLTPDKAYPLAAPVMNNQGDQGRAAMCDQHKLNPKELLTTAAVVLFGHYSVLGRLPAFGPTLTKLYYAHTYHNKRMVFKLL